MPKSQAEENTNDKQYAARLFLFYMQNKNKSQAWQIPLKRIRARGLYNAHKQEFNKLTEVFCKYNLDIDRYMRYFVEVLDMHEKDLKTELANSKNIMQYIGYLLQCIKHDKVYKWFVKSALNIAEECIKLGYFTTKDFIRHLITNKKIAEYFISGRISVYYFAAIPNFKKIIMKLDKFSREELVKLYNRFEMYNAEITAAFMKKTNHKVNPIKFTDLLIYKIRHSKPV